MKVVKLALTQNSKRASSYAKVFIAAQDADIDCEDLKDWIIKKGGIEKIRLSLGEYKSTDDYFVDGKESMASMKALVSFAVEDIEAEEDELVVMIGRVGPNSKVEVLKIAATGNENAFVKSTIASVTKKESANIDTEEFELADILSLKTEIERNKAENTPSKSKKIDGKDAA